MRTIKYKGKRKDNGGEVEGSLILPKTGDRAFIGYAELVDNMEVIIVHYNEVDPKTVELMENENDQD